MSLAKEMFGKALSELTITELREYRQEKRRRYLKTHPEAKVKIAQTYKNWKEKNRDKMREYLREYYRKYRADGKSLNYSKLYKRAFELICDKALFNDVFGDNRNKRKEWFLFLAREEVDEKKGEQ